jgi:acetyl-CoA synthetase
VRKIEFYELPKTISGKIRRVELRAREEELFGSGGSSTEYSDADSPELRG